MKKLTLSILAVLALTLAGCEKPTASAQQRAIINQPQNNPCMSRIFFDGHYYVKYETHSRIGIISIVHDPDCPCHEKGGSHD